MGLLPRTTRVYVHSVAVASDADIASVRIWFEGPNGVTQRILLATGSSATMTDPVTNQVDISVCGRPVPREPNGSFWQLKIATTGKAGDGSAVVDWTLGRYPDSGENDSP